MAGAGTDTTPTKYHPGEGRERAGKSAVEDLQQASAEIGTAHREATADGRRSLGSTPEGMRDVSGELCQPAEDQTGEWQEALERSSEKARRQMGRRGIRAQYTPEALKELWTRAAKAEDQAGAAGTDGATVARANRLSPEGGTGPPAKRLLERRVRACWPRSTPWS